MIALGNKGTINGYMLQYEEGKPALIEELDVIFNDVLEEVMNRTNTLIGEDVGI